MNTIAKGSTPELPAGTETSPELRDFLSRCFQNDPLERWNAYELLNHPFITEEKKGIIKPGSRMTQDDEVELKKLSVMTPSPV